MKLAANAMFKQILEHKLISTSDRVYIFTGSGNNGGDGYELGALLLKANYQHIVVVSVLPQKDRIDANEARTNYLEHGGVEIPFLEFSKEVDEIDVIVDAILGVGVTKRKEEKLEEIKIENKFPFEETVASEREHKEIIIGAAIDYINYCKTKVISLDMPSMLNTDNGCVVENVAGKSAVRANYTITVFANKLGLLLGYAKNYTGEILVALDDLPDFEKVLEDIVGDNKCIAVRYDSIKSLIPYRENCAHKGDAGKLLLIGGNKGMEGALILASQAAIRTGAGLVCAIPLSGSTMQFNIVNPVIMTGSVDNVCVNVRWSDAVVFGPGMGRNITNDDLLGVLRSYGETMKVVDADGLYLLKENQITFKYGCVLTPHVGEAAYLCDVSIRDVYENPIYYAKYIANKYNAICVLKSATTIITNGNNEVYIAATGSKGMASGGMGDVLSGIIGAFIANGVSPLLAALLGVCVHGESGVRAASNGGVVGMCAVDLFPHIRELVSYGQ